MIKLFSTIAAAAAIIAAGTAASAAVGDVVGNVYSTDILATVNGEPIPSYALDGKTAIALRDLEHYGFSIYYSESSRLAQANLDMHSIEEYTPIEGVERGTVGEITGNIYESDITAYINGESVSSYNIGGRLVVVIEDIAPHDDGSEFSQYGYAKTGLTYVWDAENRRIDLITLPEDNQYESTYKAMSNRLTLSIDGDRLVVTKDRIADKYISPGSYRGIAGYSVVGNQIFPIKYTYNDGHEEDIGLLYGFYGIMTDETGAVIGRTDTMNNTGIHIDQAKLNAIIAENYVEPLTFDEEIEFWRNGGTSMWRVTAEIYTDNYVILDMMMSGLPHGGAAYSTIRIDRDPIETTEIMTDNISDPELYSDTEPDILYYFRGSYLYKRNVLTGAEEEVCAATTENVLNYLKEHWETVYEKSADGITSLLMRRGDDYRVYTISPNGLKVIRGPIDEAYFYNNSIFVRYNGKWRFELYNELPDEYMELVETEGERIDTAS